MSSVYDNGINTYKFTIIHIYVHLWIFLNLQVWLTFINESSWWQMEKAITTAVNVTPIIATITLQHVLFDLDLDLSPFLLILLAVDAAAVTEWRYGSVFISTVCTIFNRAWGGEM